MLKTATLPNTETESKGKGRKLVWRVAEKGLVVVYSTGAGRRPSGTSATQVMNYQENFEQVASSTYFALCWAQYWL